jgi:DNA topoisomerase I
MKLVIVESPAKCKKIESFLGKDYRCIASYGHICEISNGLKSIDIENNYTPKFDLMKNKLKNINILRKEIRDASEVIIATDDDREGEAIGWHICNVFNLPVNVTKRIIFREITKNALVDAVQNPTIIDINKVNSQKARMVLDLLVGYLLSPILWKQISANKDNKLSAGRCQTPALKIIYENQIEIDNSPGEKVYDITGYFTTKNLPFKLDKYFNSTEEVEDFLEQSISFKHIININEPKETFKNPSSPLTTSGLQQIVSNEFHYSPKVTMEQCQKLYEGGYITYMRTDSKKYSQEFIDLATIYIKNVYGKDNLSENPNQYSLENKEINKKKKKNDNAQEAHESIRPTNIDLDIIDNDKIDHKGKKIYKLIRNITIESLMKKAKCLNVAIKITAPKDTNYKHNEELIIEPGWKLVRGYEKENINYNLFTSGTIKNGKKIKYNKIYAKFTLKDLKIHYTEARLVQLLEENGIGRPSTFSSLISKIQERKYVIRENIQGKEFDCIEYELEDNEISEIETKRTFGNEKNKLVLTALGKIVIEFLLKYFDDLFVYEYTGNMETNLDTIAKGDKVWYELCKNCHTDVNKLIKNVDKNDKTKTLINDKYEYLIGKYGPVLKYEEDGKTKFLSVKKDLDINKLKRGEYEIKDIIAETQVEINNYGKYNNNDLIVKTGKFGKYVSYNNKTYSLKVLENNITKDGIISVINGEKDTSIVKKINNDISIRNGKYGEYMFYKTSTMNKPKFIPLKDIKNSYNEMTNDEIISWVNEKK